GLAVVATLALVLTQPAPARAAAPRFVQKRYLRVLEGNSVSVTFRRPNSAGNLIIAYLVWDNGGGATLSDTRGNTYTSAIGPTQAKGDASSAQIFYASSIGAGTNTVTATFATAITTRGVLYVHEYSGLDPAAPLGAVSSMTGAGEAMDTGVVTTGSANWLLFA